MTKKNQQYVGPLKWESRAKGRVFEIDSQQQWNAAITKVITKEWELKAQLTKSQVQQIRDCRIKHGQSVAQKTVRNMSTKDNPGTLPINLYLTERPTSQPFDFGRIGEVQGEKTETIVIARRERGRKEGSSDLVQSSGDIVYLASDASSFKCRN
ncbi:unnamed protein product [Porites evermanni]|uniref:Uncharacterized protein n=1 Tax=Porites evermanni TaxID=104178 RepID=A0ABN8PD94_9CNID|nr:unnamed protein product [Porites evermanni]